MINEVSIVVPVYNDWESWWLLARAINTELLSAKVKYRVILVNDGSLTEPPSELFSLPCDLRLITLTRNLGHQKAIAIGLSYVATHFPDKYTVVMDSDGEDKAEDILKLLQAAEENPQQIIFAARKKRNESLWFRVGYSCYKCIFKILTGKTIRFGNFSLIPPVLLSNLVHVSEIWNNYPGGVIVSKMPIRTLSLDRGIRLAGKSKMNITSLIHHGLCAVSVHIEVMAVRILIACTLLSLMSLVAILVVVYLRLFTAYASPGWATTIVTSGSIFIFQTLIMSTMMVFLSLRGRMNNYIIPIKNYVDFIKQVDKNA